MEINNKRNMLSCIDAIFKACEAEGHIPLLLHTQKRTKNGLKNTNHGYDAWREATRDEVVKLMDDDGGLFLGGTYVGGGLSGRHLEGLWVRTNNNSLKICLEGPSEQ